MAFKIFSISTIVSKLLLLKKCRKNSQICYMKDCPFESSCFEWSCLGHPVIPTAEAFLQRDARLGGAGGRAHYALCPQHWAAQRTVLACVRSAGHTVIVPPFYPPCLSLSFLAVSVPNAGVPFHFRCYSVWGSFLQGTPSCPILLPIHLDSSSIP